MVSYKLVLLSENAAFEENPQAEIARILREEITRISRAEGTAYFTSPLMDINGNTVGNVTFSR